MQQDTSCEYQILMNRIIIEGNDRITLRLFRIVFKYDNLHLFQTLFRTYSIFNWFLMPFMRIANSCWVSCLVILNEIQGFLIANERCKDEVKTSKNSRTVKLIFYQFVPLIFQIPTKTSKIKHVNVVAEICWQILL